MSLNASYEDIKNKEGWKYELNNHSSYKTVHKALIRGWYVFQLFI